MKKIVLLAVLVSIGITNSLWSQNWQQLSVGPTFSSLNYRVDDGSSLHPFSTGFGIEYRTPSKSISFLDSWSIGFSYSNLEYMWGLVSNRISHTKNNGDIVFCNFSGFSENHTAHFFSITPMGYIKIKQMDKLVLGIGPSIGLLRGRWDSYGQMTTSLMDSATEVILRDDLGGYGLGTFSAAATDSYSKFVLGAALEAGYRVSKEMYVGAYGKICSISGIKGDNPIVTGVGESESPDVVYQGLVQSSLLSGGRIVELGIKLGYRFGEKQAKQPVVSTNNIDWNILLEKEKENEQLKRRIEGLEDSLKTQILGLDSNNIRRVDVLARDYARLCLAAPYDQAKYDNYKDLFGRDGFATRYYKNRCAGYLKLLGMYEEIQNEYYQLLKDFGAVYVEKKRTERGPVMKDAYQKLLNYQKTWDAKIKAIDDNMEGLVDVPYINNQLEKSLQKMEEWINNNRFLAWEDVRLELRIEQ